MVKPVAPDDIDRQYAKFQFEGFNWRYRKILNHHYQVDFQIWGPLCIKKSCFGEMQNPSQNLYRCGLCGYENKIMIDGLTLSQKVQAKLKGEWTKGLKFSNFDKLPAINESCEEENRFYKVAVEHDIVGNLHDIHILIGKKENGGKKAHIIISPEGEIRLDKKDLHPSDEIKSITSIIYK